MNAGKSELFAVGLREDYLQHILQVTGFRQGKLPMRYLGVPLVTRKLIVRDCEPLIKKIMDRIEYWSAKFLSYA